MRQGERHIIRPIPGVTQDVVHLYTDQTHEVEVIQVDSKDPTRVFLTCLTHGHSHWVHTFELIVETQDKEPAAMHNFKLFFAALNHKTDTEIHMDQFATREAQAADASELVNQYAEIKSPYVIIKNLDDNTLLIWDRVDNCPRNIAKRLFVKKAKFRVSFTGHRPHKLGRNGYAIDAPIRQWIRQMIKAELQRLLAIYPDLEVIVGGALGVDTDAALVAIELGITYHVFAPCHEQYKTWKTQEDVNRWVEIWEKAPTTGGTTRYIHEGPYNGPKCMDDRNKAMVDASNLVISVYDGSSGGTKNCIDYARSKGKEIINFNPKEANLPGIKAAAATEGVTNAIAYFDGACRGNPGPATAGVLIVDEQENILFEHGFKVSNMSTNNVAEWHGLVAAMRSAAQLGITHLEIRGDSELVIKQMRGEYKVKDAKLLPLYNEALELGPLFRKCVFMHVPREDNPADATANSAF
jgi:ribonuclease HI